jgi:ADP-ribose pyrophosphatase
MIEQLLSTPRFRVERRTIESPREDPLTRDVVVHPGAVVILPLLDDGRIVMIRQFRHAVGEELWELPAGTREPAEAPIDTARRELEEEAGYQASEVTPLSEFFTSPGILSEQMFAFTARDLTPVPQRLERGEKIQVVPLAADDVRILMLEGEIRDGKTLAVLGLHFMQLARKDSA